MHLTLAALFATGALSQSYAQVADTTRLSTTENSISIDPKTGSFYKPAPSLYYVPYYFNPIPLNVTLTKSKLPTSSLLLKRNSIDNAMNSINSTLANDKKNAEAYKVAGMFFEAAVLGGVVYQAVNGKKFSEEAQRRREAKSQPPARRR